MMRVAMIPLVLLLGACALPGNNKDKAKETAGSLYHTYSLTDDQGRKAGTLVTSPTGQAELRDADGNLIGILVLDRDAKVPKETADKK